jgi:hypothetical protein
MSLTRGSGDTATEAIEDAMQREASDVRPPRDQPTKEESRG